MRQRQDIPAHSVRFVLPFYHRRTCLDGNFDSKPNCRGAPIPNLPRHQLVILHSAIESQEEGHRSEPIEFAVGTDEFRRPWLRFELDPIVIARFPDVESDGPCIDSRSFKQPDMELATCCTLVATKLPVAYAWENGCCGARKVSFDDNHVARCSRFNPYERMGWIDVRYRASCATLVETGARCNLGTFRWRYCCRIGTGPASGTAGQGLRGPISTRHATLKPLLSGATMGAS